MMAFSRDEMDTVLDNPAFLRLTADCITVTMSVCAKTG